MPRGRKGPPQDSIDSILLALSRRTDIDNETLSHYFDRLDEEWADGARDKVLHLLHTNDAAAHSAYAGDSDDGPCPLYHPQGRHLCSPNAGRIAEQPLYIVGLTSS